MSYKPLFAKTEDEDEQKKVASTDFGNYKPLFAKTVATPIKTPEVAKKPVEQVKVTGQQKPDSTSLMNDIIRQQSTPMPVAQPAKSWLNTLKETLTGKAATILSPQTMQTAKNAFGMANTFINPVQTITNKAVNAVRNDKSLIDIVNSGLGFAKEMGTGLVKTYTEPSAETRQAETKLGIDQLAPVPKILSQGFVRTFAPMEQPFAEIIGKTVASNEISDKIAKGELPQEAAIAETELNKKWSQVLGDVSQAVLGAYTPSILGKGFGKGVVKGTTGGMGVGLTFGTAQALSTGSTDPREIAEILLKNTIFGGVFGTATGFLGKIGKRVGEDTTKRVQSVDALTILNQYADKPITKSSSLEDIKLAYYSAAKKNHPDKGGDAAVFSDINKAYEFLMGKQDKFVRTSKETNEPVRGFLDTEEAARAPKENIKTKLDKTANELKLIAEKGDDIPDVVVEKLNKTQEEFNDYTEANKEPVVLYEGKPDEAGITPKIDLSVVKFDDNKFGVAYEVNAGLNSLVNKFETSPEFNTPGEAVVNASKEILNWAQEQEPVTQAEHTELTNIVKSLADVLNGRKTSLEAQGEVVRQKIENEQAKKLTDAVEPVKEVSDIPKTVNVWKKSKFSNDGAYVDIPVIRKVDNTTLYQGGSADNRQFWTDNEKYASQFGEVTKKTGSFYQVDNGNRVTNVFVKVPKATEKTITEQKKEPTQKEIVKTSEKEIIKGDEVLRIAMKLGGETIYSNAKEAIKSQNFKLETVKISDILKNDLDAKEYVDANNNRYGKKKQGVDNPIIIGKWQGKNNSVIDGYNRLLTKVQNGDTTIKAYVAIKKVSERENPTIDVKKESDLESFVKEHKGERLMELDGNELIIDSVYNGDVSLIIPNEPGRATILSKEEVKSLISKQEEIKEQYAAKYLERKLQEKRDEVVYKSILERDIIENDLYGYEKTLSALSKGRIVPILNKKIRTKDMGVVTKKEFILKRIVNNDFEVTETGILRKKGENAGYELNKTEAKFAEWIQNNKKTPTVETPKPKVTKKVLPSTKAKEILDFGEKIGGAKKEQWSKRGLGRNDLAIMNEREVAKHLKKDNIWPKNYDALVAEGVSPLVIAFNKMVRDSVQAKVGYLYKDNTPELKTDRNLQYLDFVNGVKEAMSEVKTPDDAVDFYRKFLVDNNFKEAAENERGYDPSFTAKAISNPFLNNKFLKAARVNLGVLEREAVGLQIGVKAEDKLPRGISVMKFDGDRAFSIIRNSRYITKSGFASEAEAIKWAKENLKAASVERKKKYIPPQLASIKRTGVDYRKNNTRDITGEDLIKELGFKGGEFGNWLNANDRQTSLNYAYDALRDLSDALGIKETDISLGKTLSIAFGARGTAGAAAHYEPERKVFNLTKMNGAGSTAHEWFHALEDYLGKEGKTFKAFDELKQSLAYKQATPEEVAISNKKYYDKYQGYIDRGLTGFVERTSRFSALPENKKAEYFDIKKRILDGDRALINSELTAFVKSNTGRMLPNDDRYRLESWARFADNALLEKEVRIPTTFKESGVKLDSLVAKADGYWQSQEELLARAFAAYITDKTNKKSDYLSGHSEGLVSDGKGNEFSISPLGEERIVINKKFDDFFNDLKERGIFTNKEKDASVKEVSYKEKNLENYGIQELDETFSGEKLVKRLEETKKRLGLDFDIELFDKIYTGEMLDRVVTEPNGSQRLEIIPGEAAGVTYKNVISFAKEATKFADQHELIHIIRKNKDVIPMFSEYFTPENEAKILAEAKEAYGDKYPNEDIEEVLARGFEDFVYNKQTFTGKIKEFFRKILDQIKQFLNFERKVDLVNFYNDVLYKKSDKIVRLEPKTRLFGKEGRLNGKRIIDFKEKAGASFLEKTVSSSEKYAQEMTRKAEEARGVEKPGVKAYIKNLAKDAKVKFIDFTAPIEDLLYATTKKEGIILKPSEDIHNQIDRVLRAPTLAGQFIKDSGLARIVAEVDNINNFDQYLIAKHAVELFDQGVETGRDINKDEQLIRDFKEKYEDNAKGVYKASRKLLDYSVDSGLIDAKLGETLKDLYPNYVPFNRVFSEIEKSQDGTGGKAVASLSKQSVVQRISGSEREIESPVESLFSKANDAFKQGEKNKAARLLVGYKELPGNPFKLEEITDARPKKLGEETISYLDNGVKKTYTALPDVVKAAKALDVQQLNILGEILAFPTRVAKLGITGVNIPFVATNVLKDTTSAFINSDRGLKTSVANPKVFLQAFVEALTHGNVYEEMVRAGGGGTSYDITRNQAKTTVEKIRSGRSVFSKIKYTAKNPMELLRAVEDIIGRSEEFTRVKQYIGTKEALLKEGFTMEEAEIGSARAAREDTTNFARMGEWGKVLSSALLYFNAGLQGTRNLLRNLKKKPVATSTKIATAALFPVALATAWNLKNEETRAIYNDIPEWEKENNIIIVPLNATKNANGSYNVVKIPVSPEVNNLTNYVRLGVESLYGGADLTFNALAGALFGTVTPFDTTPRSVLSSLTPQALKPTVEDLTNTNLFTGNKIVGEYMKNLEPEQQVYEDTSGTARAIGKALDVSPLRVEAFMKSTFGEVALQGENLSDRVLNYFGLIPDEQIGGRGIVEGVTRRFATASSGATYSEQKGDLTEAMGSVSSELSAAKNEFKPTYDKIKKLVLDGKTDEAKEIVNGLSDSDYVLYKALLKSDKTKKSNKMKVEVYPKYLEVVELVKDGKRDQAKAILDAMTDDEYKAYKSLKNSLSD